MADEIAVGEKIRRFFRQVFGSRLTDHLEDEIFRVRQDCEQRLNDRDVRISELKQENQELKAKIDVLETIVLPLTTGGLLNRKKRSETPTFEPVTEPDPNSWAAIQAEHYRKEQEEAEKEKQ